MVRPEQPADRPCYSHPREGAPRPHRPHGDVDSIQDYLAVLPLSDLERISSESTAHRPHLNRELSPSGPTSALAFADTIHLFVGNFASPKTTVPTKIIQINRGLFLLTPTDQPIYVQNSSFIGWLRDSQNLTDTDRMFGPVSQSWVQVTSVRMVHFRIAVYDVITSSFNTLWGMASYGT